MRKTTPCGTVRLEVRFRNAGSPGRASKSSRGFPACCCNILRGRVTARDAVYQLELSGHDAGVNEAVWSLRAGASCL